MRKDKFVVIIALTISISAVLIPIIINEAYKLGADGTGYITMWSASYALSYYGTVLGAVATIAALGITITFTKKQIQRDRFLENNRERWGKVDAVITQALIDIFPLKLRPTGNMDTSNAMIHNRLLSIQTYMILAKTSLDMIKCYIGPDEHEKIKDYIHEISKAIDQFCMIARELEIEFMALQNLAIHNGGQFPDGESSRHLDRTSEIIKKIPPVYNGSYQKLLDMKREVFDKIYADIEVQADQILIFWK